MGLVRVLFVSSFLVLAGLAPAPTARAEEIPPVLGSALTARPFVLHDDIVIEASETAGTIRDYTDPVRPQWLQLFPTAELGYWAEAHVDAGRVAVVHPAGLPGGATIYDLTEPTALTPLTTMRGAVYTSVWMRGSALYLAADTGVLLVYDVSAPNAPVLARGFLLGPHPGLRWFAAAGSHLALLETATSLRLLDVSDPLAPVDSGVVDVDAIRVDAMVARGDRLYLMVEDTEGLALLTLDAEDGGEVGRQRLRHGAGAFTRDMAVDDRLLVVATSDRRVRAYDLTDPEAPRAGWQLVLDALHVEIGSSQVYVETGDALHVVPRTPALGVPGDAVVRGKIPRLGRIVGRGPFQLAQVRNERDRVVVVDVRNPHAPELGPSIDVGIPGALHWGDGTAAIVSSFGKFQMLDLSDPAHPRPAGSFSVESQGLSSFQTVLSGGTLVTTKDSRDTRVFDVSDPDRPFEAARTTLGPPLALDGTLLLCAGDTGLDVVDLSDLHSPRVVSTIASDAEFEDAGLHREHAYVFTQAVATPQELAVYDLREPGMPVEVARVPVDFASWRPWFDGDRMVLLGYHQGVVFDVSDPGLPRITARFPFPGPGGIDMAFDGDVVTLSGWLITRQLDAPTRATDAPPSRSALAALEAPSPNPFNPATTIAFRLERADEVTLSVYDLRGRRIVDLAHGHFEAGRHEVRWQGDDAAGQGVASGVYLIRLQGRGLDATRPVTLVK